MNRTEIILVGGGGHCKSCIDVIEFENKYIIKGIVDLPKEAGKDILGYEIFGNDKDLPALASKGYNFLITLGNMGKSKRRIELFNIIKKNGGRFPKIISPKAYVSEHSEIGDGTIIMHNAIVNADARIGENCIINNKSLIEHDVFIGDDCHISTNVVVNGNCMIQNDCFIGSGSTIKNGLKIEKETIIGLGSVVIKQISEKGVYYGNPVKRIRD
ncbi:MAG: acetyltransferase [Flavobacteriaceae bacterium]|nr:acetyltransferase [Flavobacteriaceae bacterium]